MADGATNEAPQRVWATKKGTGAKGAGQVIAQRSRSTSGKKVTGKGAGDLSVKVVRSVGISETFPYNMPTLKGDFMDVGIGGLCDPAMGNLKTRQTVFRHALGCFIGTVATNGSSIVFDEGQQVVLFENGNQGNTTNLGNIVLTPADTNAEAEGGVAKGLSQFVSQAMGISPVQPWFSAAGSESVVDDIQQPQWLRDPNVNYGAIAQRSIFDAASVEITNGDDACDYDLGPLSLWAQMSGVAEVSNGFGGFGGVMWYFATPQVSGSAMSNEQLTVTVTLQHSVTVPNSGIVNTAAGQVVVPFRVVLLGYPECIIGPAEAKVAHLATAVKILARKNNLAMPTKEEIRAWAEEEQGEDAKG